MTQSSEGRDSFDDAIEASLERAKLADVDEEAAGDAKASGRSGGLHEGVVVGLSGDDVVVEIDPRTEGVVSKDEFDEPPAVGTKLRVSVRGREDDLLLLSVRDARALAEWEEMEVGSLVKARVVGLNKGGLEAKVGSASAFLPASQVALRRVDDLEALAGQTLVCEVTEIDRERKRVVVSRRRVLEEEEAKRREEGLGRLQVGSVVRGKVVRMESFGAFVDLGHGLEGMIHVSNVSHRRVARPDEVLRVGEEVEVQVLEISDGGRRIGLGRKQLEADPWEGIEERLSIDAILQGKVMRLTDFGAFVELLPGVEGLLHVSQFGTRVRHAKDVLKQGQTLPVRVTKMDARARRVSLSRFDSSGALLGSDEAAEGSVVEEVLEKSSERTFGRSLGDLFKKALDE